MNARAKVLPSGAIAIPEDVRQRLAWEPGTPLDLVETGQGLSLRKAKSSRPYPFGGKTTEDLRALPRHLPAQPVEAISRLSDEDVQPRVDVIGAERSSSPP